MNSASNSTPEPMIRRVAKNPALWVFVFTFIVLTIHPVPECVSCEYPGPWGRNDVAYRYGADVLTAWLIVASFAAGVWNVRRNWLVPVAIVFAHLATQPIGGVPFWSLWSNEGPIILVLGLAAGLGAFITGHLVRLGVGRWRAVSHAG